jgi:hypothetical protein
MDSVRYFNPVYISSIPCQNTYVPDVNLNFTSMFDKSVSHFAEMFAIFRVEEVRRRMEGEWGGR